MTRAAGLPEAPAPGPSASMTVARNPRAAKTRARAAPAMPAPMIATRGAGGSAPGVPGQTASSRSRLRPKPGRLSTAKPSAASPRRTAPATVKVAMRAPGAERRATPASTAGLHMPGLAAGEKPSRNQASAAPRQASRASAASMIARSRVAPISSKSSR